VSLSLALHAQPSVPLEADVISPDVLNGKSGAEIERLDVLHGNERVRLAEFFTVRGSGDGRLELEGELGRIKYIGAGMSAGEIHVNGNVGAHLGAGMRGGTIVVDGNAGDWVGPEMSGGQIVIRGNAGHLTGSAFRGSPVGMTGGEIFVHGNAGNEVGHGMRNGLIAIGGDSGDFTGVNMLAGTVVVLGAPGIRTGAGMKRGTVICMKPVALLPTFAYACTYLPQFARLYLLHLQRSGMPMSADRISGRYARWSGDSVELNRGEILLYAGAA
jgi:formylmethanofuran dehydrogenase subunit C